MDLYHCSELYVDYQNAPVRTYPPIIKGRRESVVSTYANMHHKSQLRYTQSKNSSYTHTKLGTPIIWLYKRSKT